ncbi:hypothetical protein [Caudoviricetes sp.]|nr:hypothetical protein [Caudoviricetes sp.]
MHKIRFIRVISRYNEGQPNGHWFDRDTIRFFKTRLPSVAYEHDGNVFFITRETDPSGKTAYSVREQLHDGSIETVYEFHSFATREAAMAALKEVANAKWWSESLGRIELRIPLDLARSCSHQGDCENDVVAARGEALIKQQLDRLVPSTVAESLKEYGAWSDEELADHDMNLTRLLWCACGDIVEENVD